MTAPASSSATVALYELHIGEIEDGLAEVGRPDTGVFVSLPAEGIELISDLQQGLTLAEVSERFAQRHGQAPDLDDFLAALADCGFIRQDDSEATATVPADERSRGRATQMRGWHLLSSLPTAWVAWTVSRSAIMVWLAIWAAVPAVLAVRPDLFPNAGDARLGLGVAADLVALTILGWLLVFVHEVAHLVAVRARGCTGVLRLSHRLHLLVAETDMSAVRSLPRSQRYAPYLAGMTFNVLLLLVCVLAQLAGAPTQPFAVLGYICLMTLLFELAFFLRTDLYYVIATALRLGNLMSDTWRWLGNRLAVLLRRPLRYDQSVVPARELRVVRWYSVVLVLGVGAVVGQFVTLGLPLLVSFVHDCVRQIAVGPSTAGFWDAVVLLAITVAHFGTLGVVAVRRRLHRSQ